MIEAIVFDFDGVITQSNYIRNQTYFNILKNVPDSEKFIREAITEDSRRDRYEIIQTALKKLKEKNLMQFRDLQKETEKYVNVYNKITEKEVSRTPEVSGAENALMQLSQKYPLFVITGTLQKSLDIVMRNRQLTKYFKKSYGGYRDKIRGMEILLKENRINPKNSVFVGDNKIDYECAKYHEMYFVGVINKTNDFSGEKDIKWKLKNLIKLPEMIKKINQNI